MVKRLLITPGEPAGIGPDIVIQLAQQAWPAELIVIGDADMLTERAQLLKLPLHIQLADLSLSPQPHQAGTIKLLPVAIHSPVIAGTLNPDNADYVMQTLTLAASLALNKKADAIVTGPVNKSVINQAGIAFTGHTEFFADSCQVPATVMLFVVDQLKVALATTHLPLAKVSAAITEQNLRQTLTILQKSLQEQFHLAAPRLLVCGLNPHAGEGGYLGREEIDVISPLLNQLRAENYQIEGPLPADTIFTQHMLQRADAVLAMYHDQALPLVKYLGFGHAVNMTLGLPFIRTSVDHGTALDIAGTGKADVGSLMAAVKLAIELG